MFTFIDSFTPPTCPSAMPEKTRVYILGVSKIKEKGKIKPNPPENNKTKQNTNQIKKKIDQNQTYQVFYPSPERRNGVQTELFRNLSPLMCNTAAVRWIRGATRATGVSPGTRGEDLSPTQMRGCWHGLKGLTLQLHTPTRTTWRGQVWGGGIRPPLLPTRGPGHFCCAWGELGVPRQWTGTLGWLGYLHTLIAMSRCLHLPCSLLQGETATGSNSTCAVLVTSQAAISSPVAMETTRPQHQLAVQYIIYLFFFTQLIRTQNTEASHRPSNPLIIS